MENKEQINLQTNEGILTVLEDVVGRLMEKKGKDFTANESNAIVNALRLCKAINDGTKAVESDKQVTFKINI